MREFEKLARLNGWTPKGTKRGGKLHPVAALSHKYCLSKPQIYAMLKSLEVAATCDILASQNNADDVVHPTLILEAAKAGAAAPTVLAQAVTNGWTRQQVRLEVNRRKQAATPPLPAGQYDVLLVDPPWPYQTQILQWGPTDLHYDTMSLEALTALPIPQLTAPNATLFLWTTNPFLAEGLTLLTNWGFAYKTNLVWIKRDRKRPGSGYYVRGHHELLFIGTRGRHVPDNTGKAPISSIIESSVREHSRKPDKAYAVIEALYPDARRIELFARGSARLGWTTWGREA